MKIGDLVSLEVGSAKGLIRREVAVINTSPKTEKVKPFFLSSQCDKVPSVCRRVLLGSSPPKSRVTFTESNFRPIDRPMNVRIGRVSFGMPMAIGDRTRCRAQVKPDRPERFSPAQIKTSQTAAAAADDDDDLVVAPFALSRPLLIKLFIKIFRFLNKNNDEAANRVFSVLRAAFSRRRYPRPVSL